MTEKELKNQKEVLLQIGTKRSNLKIEDQKGTLMLIGAIFQGRTTTQYRHPIGSTLLKNMKVNEDGEIWVTYKELADNVSEMQN